MAELYSFEDLPEYFPTRCLIQSIGTFLQLIQHCMIHKLKD